MSKMFSTKEVARFLGVNEKMVYSLVSEKGLPATKVTGKWIFPRHLVEQWVEANTVNYPRNMAAVPPYEGLLVIAGSNDILLDNTISLFNTIYPNHLAVFGNLGSMGGLRSLRRNLCHIAASHLLQENNNEYNFDFAGRQFDQMPVVVNFCKRQQGLLLGKDNPKKIEQIKDLTKPGIRIINRSLATGTRLLFDRELKKAGVKGQNLMGYDKEVHRHMDVGLEILSGRADAGPGIQPVASLLGLDFIPVREERFDFLITKERFFDQGIQYFLGILHEEAFKIKAGEYDGYNLDITGKMVFPTGNGEEKGAVNPE